MVGVQRCIIVQSITHAYDNAAVEDAILAKAGHYKGVALLPTDVAESELRRLDAAGFCGIRYSYVEGMKSPQSRIEEVVALSPRLADLGWHLQIQLDPQFFGTLSPWLRKLDALVVIDHMGRVDASKGIAQEPFEHLCRLMDSTNFHVKLSGAEKVSRQGAPYRDAVPFGRKLVEDYGDRVFWGSDWPHPGYAGEKIPDDGVLVDLIAEFAPSERQRQAVLVDNPQRFYRFPSAQGLIQPR
jgi:2-pyrone-4,6-dicarboxylate lactonase